MIMDKYNRAFKTDLGTNMIQPSARGIDMDALYANQRMQQQVSLSMGSDTSFGFGFYDKNKDNRYAYERIAQMLIESSVDIGNMII